MGSNLTSGRKYFLVKWGIFISLEKAKTILIEIVFTPWGFKPTAFWHLTVAPDIVSIKVVVRINMLLFVYK